MKENRGNFGSMFGALVAMAGSAVGLGNLWRFPYLVGTNGGAAFIIIYLLFVFILCVPIMVAEFVIGRRSQSNVFGAFKILAPGSKWGITGIIAMVASISILSFYSVVGGWTIDYLVRAISFHLYPAAGESYETAFHSMASAPVQPLIYTLIFLLITGAIVLGGVKKGIEKYTKIMMPLLFVMVIIIAIRSISLPNSQQEMLLIDDMGCEPTSVKSYGTEYTPLIELLYKRLDKRLLTLITTNLSLRLIADTYGLRVWDRMKQMFVGIEFKNKSYRI